jgi:hypothetical protein
LAVFRFYLLLHDREGHDIFAAVSQLDGESCQPEHIP